MRWPLRSLSATLLVLSTSPLLVASQFEPVGDRQLVCESTDIVRGTVTSVEAAWDPDHTAIWTTAAVQVEEVLRGTRPAHASIQVKEVGGTVNDYTVKAEGFPTFRQGEEVVLLLQPWEDEPSVYRVWGYGRGLYAVTRHDAAEAVATRYDVLESKGQATMHVDRVPAAARLSALSAQLAGLARSCEGGKSKP